MKIYHPPHQYPIPFAYAYLPHQGEQSSKKERRIGIGPLGVITESMRIPNQKRKVSSPVNHGQKSRETVT